MVVLYTYWGDSAKNSHRGLMFIALPLCPQVYIQTRTCHSCKQNINTIFIYNVMFKQSWHHSGIDHSKFR